MIKRSLFALLAAAAAVAFCASPVGASDLTLGTCIAHKEVKLMCGSFSWYGMDQVTAQHITARGFNVLDAGSKLQDKGGDFMVIMSGEAVDDSGKRTPIPEIELRGMTFAGVNQFLRVQQKHADQLIGLGEDMQKHGKRKHFGKAQ